jgi:GntR family transcriptional regulator
VDRQTAAPAKGIDRKVTQRPQALKTKMARSISSLTGVKRRPGVPLHHQVYLVLQDNILTKRFPPDAVLPSEDELAQTFGVSRVTLRAAMASLEAQGLVERRQGVGTFVKGQDIAQSTPLHAAMADVLTHMEDISSRTSARVVEFGHTRGPDHVRAMFDLSDDALMQRFVRVRYFRDSRQPILFLTSYMPPEFGRHIVAKDLKDGSVRQLLLRAGVTLTSGEQVVGAVLADPVVAASLSVDIGAPLLQIQRIHRNSRKQPVWFLEVLGSPRHFKLHMELRADDLLS